MNTPRSSNERCKWCRGTQHVQLTGCTALQPPNLFHTFFAACNRDPSDAWEILQLGIAGNLAPLESRKTEAEDRRGPVATQITGSSPAETSDALDASRYRWLRMREYIDIAACWLLDKDDDADNAEQLDAAIDRAIGAEKAKGDEPNCPAKRQRALSPRSEDSRLAIDRRPSGDTEMTLEQIPFCRCVDPENCTQRITGYTCQKDFKRSYENMGRQRGEWEDAPAMHASAPKGLKCSDCTIDREPCPACYTAWWKAKHPEHYQPGWIDPRSLTPVQLIEHARRLGLKVDPPEPGDACDAARYRYLRDERRVMLNAAFFGNAARQRSPQELDAVIDSALSNA